MIDMVLATELSKHFEHVNKFISVVTKSHNSNANEQVDVASFAFNWLFCDLWLRVNIIELLNKRNIFLYGFSVNFLIDEMIYKPQYYILSKNFYDAF